MGARPPFTDAKLSAALLEAIPDLIGIIRRDGLVEHVRLPGHRPELEDERERWQGFEISSVMSAEDAAEWEERVRRCIDTGNPERGLYEPNHSAQSRSWDVRLVRFSDDQALALARDVTDQSRKDRERRAAIDLMHGVASRVPILDTSSHFPAGFASKWKKCCCLKHTAFPIAAGV